MLTPTGQKFYLKYHRAFHEENGELFLDANASIRYGNYSSRTDPETGVKAQDATLYQNDIAVAFYDASSDDVYLA